MKKGFTLVELMIVVVLIAISVGVTGDVLTSLVRSYNKTQVTTEIEQQANFLKLKLEKELRGARNISTSANSLTFTPSSTGIPITYTVTAGHVVSRTVGSGGSAVTSDVTSNTVPGGASVFCGAGDTDCSYCFQATTTGNSTTVDTCLVMRQASGTSGASFTGKTVLKTTIVPRDY